MAVGSDVRLFNRLDVKALLHLPREVLFIVGGKEVNLADLAQIHAHRVIDAFGLLREKGQAGDVFVLFLFFFLVDSRDGFVVVINCDVDAIFIFGFGVDVDAGQTAKHAANFCVGVRGGTIRQYFICHRFRRFLLGALLVDKMMSCHSGQTSPCP